MDWPVKETLFVGCARKSCCTRFTVHPTGEDVWRIATALQVPPWSFLEAVAAEDDASDGFALDDTGRRQRLALRRQVAGDGTAPCTFLMQLPDGTARCSLGALRPQSCRTYPAVMVDGVLHMRNDGCTCRTWTLADVDPDAEVRGLQAEAAERETYCRMVARWNDFATGQPPSAGIGLPDFCRFLLDMYGQLDAARAEHS